MRMILASCIATHTSHHVSGRQSAPAVTTTTLQHAQLTDCHPHLQDSQGVMRWRSVKVYKLDDVFKLVTDLQKRFDQHLEEEPERCTRELWHRTLPDSL